MSWLGAIAAPLPWGESPRTTEDRLEVIDADFLLEVHEATSPPASAGVPRLRLEHGPPVEASPWVEEELRLILLTSGSTGSAKVVPLTGGQLLYSCLGAALRLGPSVQDRWLCCLPLHHVAGLSILFRAAWAQGTVELREGFEPQEVAARLDSGEVTLISLVPTMLQRLLDHREPVPFPAALRGILLGGAAASDALLARCREIAAPVRLTWGMTETAAQVATMGPDDPLETGQAGPPHVFASVSADDGALVVHGPVVLGESLRTSDRGHVDGRGRVHIHHSAVLLGEPAHRTMAGDRGGAK